MLDMFMCELMRVVFYTTVTPSRDPNLSVLLDGDFPIHSALNGYPLLYFNDKKNRLCFVKEERGEALELKIQSLPRAIVGHLYGKRFYVVSQATISVVTADKGQLLQDVEMDGPKLEVVRSVITSPSALVYFNTGNEYFHGQFLVVEADQFIGRSKKASGTLLYTVGDGIVLDRNGKRWLDTLGTETCLGKPDDRMFVCPRGELWSVQVLEKDQKKTAFMFKDEKSGKTLERVLNGHTHSKKCVALIQSFISLSGGVYVITVYGRFLDVWDYGGDMTHVKSIQMQTEINGAKAWNNNCDFCAEGKWWNYKFTS